MGWGGERLGRAGRGSIGGGCVGGGSGHGRLGESGGERRGWGWRQEVLLLLRSLPGSLP